METVSFPVVCICPPTSLSSNICLHFHTHGLSTYLVAGLALAE